MRTEVMDYDGEKRSVDIFKCGGCGREWDGNAQCFPCDGDEEGYEDEEEKEDVEAAINKRKAALTDFPLLDFPLLKDDEAPSPSKRTRVLNTDLAEEQINEILDTLPPDVAEKLSSKIAISRVGLK